MGRAAATLLLAASLAAAAWDGPHAPPARADEAETERRLKRVGVPKPLRDEVRAAVERGVAFLVAKQRADGLWADPGDVVQADVRHGDALNALCALALVHAGTDQARAAARTALAKLLPAEGAVPPQLLQTTYGAGLALLLLDATGGGRERAASIAARIASGRDPKSGASNYRTGPAGDVGLRAPPRAPEMSGPLNLSTSQFAVLGLHAAERRGAVATDSVWEDVLHGLLVAQQSDGSWTYAYHHPEVNATYPTGTLMGIANLVLAAAHLRATEDGSRGTSRQRRVAAAIEDARTALAADGTLTLWTARRGGGAVDGYSLWSLEKACVFLDAETLDGVPWYAHAARTLVDAQRGDGSWSPVVQGAAPVDELATTSFALLVLVRDIESLRALTPTEGPPPDAAVTGPSPADAPPGDEARRVGAVPIDDAAAALAALRERLGARDAPNREILDLLDLLARARDELAPAAGRDEPPPDPAVLLRGIDAAFLDALFAAGPDSSGDEEGRRPVNRRAADLLASAPGGTLMEVRRRLERTFRDARSVDGPFATTPYRPALGLLAARGSSETLAWMLDAALSDDLVGERAERALALLLAVPRFRGLPGAARLDAARSIGRRYVGRESASAALASQTPGADPRDRVRWSRFRPAVMEALLALSADPATGAEPRDARGRILLEVAPMLEWLRAHDDLRRPPWR